MAERATINISVLAGDAEDDVEELADKLKGAELRASQLDSALDLDADTVAASASLTQIGDSTEEAREEVRRLQRALNRVGRTDAEADVDVDTDRNRRGRGRLPGELDEVGEAVRFFGSLNASTKALIGATTAAAAALGTAGGLAAVATQLANEFGDLDIQQDLQQTKLQFQEVANTVSDEFEPVLRNELIPAADLLAQKLEGAADEAASFTEGTIQFTENLFQQDTSTTGGRLGTAAEIILNPFQFLGQQAEQATGFQPQFPTGQGQNRQQGQRRGIPTPRGAEAVQGGLRQVRTELGKQLRRVQVLEQVSNDQLEVAKARVSALEGARKKALKVAQQFEKGSAESKLVVQFIENLQKRLAEAREEAEKYKRQQERTTGEISDQVRSLERLQQVQGAAAAERVTPGAGPGPSPGPNFTSFGLAGSARELGQNPQGVSGASGDPGMSALTMSLQEIQTEYDVTERKAKQFKQTARQQFGSVTNAAGQMGQALVRALSRGEASAQNIAATLLQGVGGVLSVIPGAGQIAGPVLGQLGGIIGAFDSGGLVGTPLQIVGEQGPELAAMPQGSRVVSNAETRRMVEQATRSSRTTEVKVTGDVIRLGPREVGIAIREEERRRNRHR